jgi:hypothetical protein
VEIVFRVGVYVMASVMRRPPERTLLVRRRRRERHQELEDPAGLVSAMREEAMESGGDGEHADDVQCQTDGDSDHAHARPDGEQASRVHEEELNARRVVQMTAFERALIDG